MTNQSSLSPFIMERRASWAMESMKLIALRNLGGLLSIKLILSELYLMSRLRLHVLSLANLGLWDVRSWKRLWNRESEYFYGYRHVEYVL